MDPWESPRTQCKHQIPIYARVNKLRWNEMVVSHEQRISYWSFYRSYGLMHINGSVIYTTWNKFVGILCYPFACSIHNERWSNSVGTLYTCMYACMCRMNRENDFGPWSGQEVQDSRRRAMVPRGLYPDPLVNRERSSKVKKYVYIRRVKNKKIHFNPRRRETRINTGIPGCLSVTLRRVGTYMIALKT